MSRPGGLRGWMIAGAALATAATGAAQAQPAPPATKDRAGIEAWIAANLAVEGWSLIQVDPAGVTFGGPGGISEQADGTLKAEIRREYFGPDQLGPDGARSTLQTWNVDCKGPRLRILSMQIFQGNNLGGLDQKRENAEAPWAPPREGSMNAQIVSRMCAARLRPAN